MKNRKFLALLISLVLLVGLAASCGSDEPKTSEQPPANTGTSTPDSTPTATLQVPDVSMPEEGAKVAEHLEIVMPAGGISSINPHLGASGGANWTVYIMIYDRLVYRVEGGNTFAGQLATRWETDDYQTFTFYLRDDVNFHNGDHFTADDVVWNIEYSKANPAGEASMTWGKVASVKALDTYTVQLVTYGVEVEFLYEIANPYAGMISPRALQENPETGAWVGTGPWKVSSFVSDVLMERNEDFWGEVPLTKTIAFRDIPEPSARRIMMLNGECDFSFGISGEDIVFFENDPRFTIYPQRSPMMFSIWFNMEHPITSDINFRLAVAHALNLEDIALVAGGKMADAVTGGTFWGRTTQFRRNDLPNREYNLDLAKQYLAASSYNGERIDFVAFIDETIRGAEVVQQQLAEIGIDIFVNVTDMPGFISMAQPHDNKLVMAFGLSNPSLYASSMRQFIYPMSIRNGNMYNNPRVTELLDLCMTELDENVRAGYWSEIQQLMYDDVHIIPVFWLVHGYVADSRLGGFYITEETSMHNFRNVFLLLDD